MDNTLIIAGCKEGNRHAQKTLFDQYAKGMLLLCCRYVPNKDDAEELLLNGFYKFFAAIKQFDYINDPSLTAWLKKIMVNECLMFLRRESKVAFTEDTYDKEVLLHADILDTMEAKAIHKTISTLPEGYRIVFNLFVIEGYSHKEIAKLLQISESTSKSQLLRAKVCLQKLLEKNGIIYEAR